MENLTARTHASKWDISSRSAERSTFFSEGNINIDVVLGRWTTGRRDNKIVMCVWSEAGKINDNATTKEGSVNLARTVSGAPKQQSNRTRSVSE